MSDTVQFDLDAYLGRIGWKGERTADLETLRGVHLAHSQAIPFETLDAAGGTAPSLELVDLIAELVHGRRGGHEQNTLFTHALEALGFRETGLAARVVLEPVPVPHRGPLELRALEAFGEAEGRQAQYAFTLDPCEKPDFEVFNSYVGTSPRSPFTQRRYVQRVTPDRHALLLGASSR